MIPEFRRHALDRSNDLSWPVRLRLLLLIPGTHCWNGWVRDWTARLEGKSCYGAVALDKQPGVGEAGAVFAFGAWLTSREQEPGPFSRYRDAAPMAALCGEFCRSQDWEVDSEAFPKYLKPFPADPPPASPIDSRVRFDGAEWIQRN